MNMASLLPLFLLNFLLITKISASPFELTENYIKDFENGIEHLRHEASETVYQEGSYDPTKYDEAAALKEAHEYDFVIVGAGASGSVIANRLSEIPEWSVLLLEAGHSETPYTQIPALAHVLQGTKYNWGYTTVPQDTWCLGMVDKKCSCATGKALGGSTAINSMLYTRGNARDYDLWADHGNDGWCYKDVLPYFKKSENADLHQFDRKYHSQGGPLHVEDPQHRSQLADVFLQAGEELGMHIVDYNGKEQIGFGKTQATTKHGKRNSAAAAYLQPAAKRKNLHIQPLSQVIEIVINPHTKEASGVKYLHGEKLYVAKAAKEVVLSAGALNSAQLLMLSGVGPKEELEKLHIPVVSDLKVGKHMKDHVGFLGLNFILNETLQAHEDARENLVHWLKDGKGPLSSISTEALAYLKTDASKETTNYPDVQLSFSPKAHYVGLQENHNLRIKKEVYESMYQPLEGHRTMSIVVMPTHPKSVGSVTLKSKDPFHWPLVHLNQLSDPDDHDMETMLAGVKKAIAIAETHAFQRLGAHLHPQPVAGCESHAFASDDYWKCAIRHLSISLRHQTGTCKMGPQTDVDAVVDNKLNVYGVHKLKVADASVVPVSITGHLHGPSVMIGEKAAEMIKEHWK